MNSKAFIILSFCLASIVLAVPQPKGPADFYTEIGRNIKDGISILLSLVDDFQKEQFEADLKSVATISSTPSSSENFVKQSKVALSEFFLKNVGQNILMKDFATDSIFLTTLSNVVDLLPGERIMHSPRRLILLDNSVEIYLPAYIAFYCTREGEILVRTEELKLTLTSKAELTPEGLNSDQQKKFEELSREALPYVAIAFRDQVVKSTEELSKAAGQISI